MPTVFTTGLPGIDRLNIDAETSRLVLTWVTAANNGTLLLDTRPAGGGEWTRRGTAPVTDGELSIPTTPIADGSAYDLRATIETEHETSPSVQRLLRLTLPVVTVPGSARPSQTVEAPPGTRQSVRGSASPRVTVVGAGSRRTVTGTARPEASTTTEVTHD